MKAENEKKRADTSPVKGIELAYLQSFSMGYT